ncbi:MAG: hypothetical protein WA817_09760 [Candidatus Acidiferrum sp.]
MQFHDFREAGFTELACDCGRKFQNTKKAVAHVLTKHLDAEQRKDRVRSQLMIEKMLSPNPVVCEELARGK